MKLTVFYDGRCPLCVAEMNALRKHDNRRQIQLEDIHAESFASRFPQIDPSAANRILHGMDEQGRVLLGLDVTVRAWQLLDQKRWLTLLRWPLIRPLADRSYLFFAKHRMRISVLLLGRQACQRSPLSACNDDSCVKNQAK